MNDELDGLAQYARYENAETSPPHYVATDLQPIQAIEGLGLGDGFELGNTIKYIARHERKGTPPQDIDKALCYLLRYRERRWGRIETIGEIRVTAPLTVSNETPKKTKCNDAQDPGPGVCCECGTEMVWLLSNHNDTRIVICPECERL